MTAKIRITVIKQGGIVPLGIGYKVGQEFTYEGWGLRAYAPL